MGGVGVSRDNIDEVAKKSGKSLTLSKLIDSR